MKAADDSFSTGAVKAADENVASGFYADITGVPAGATCYAKAYVVLDSDSDGTGDEYIYSDLITQAADFTKWLGAKTTNDTEEEE